MFEIRTLLILIPLFPLAAAILTAVLGPRFLRRHSHWPVILALVASFLCSVPVLWGVRSLPGNDSAVGAEAVPQAVWTWVHVPDAYTQSDVQPLPFAIDISLRADGLTALMLSMVTFIALLVAIYSVGYMHGDRGYWRFFAYVALFVFSMTMLVLVSNFLLLFVFWEAVGVCSYLLIGFWYEKDAAARAGMKAFIVNRVGDFGFALAIFLIWVYYGTLNYHDTQVPGVFGQQRLTGQVGFVEGGVATAICLLLMLGACGKSAQFPLHVWLPDAMEGPTPVSALIHAATMVTAGVYMVARCTPLFSASDDARLVVACIGGFTAILAALIALTQYDLKRVLAYSTISQLGYMFLALGTGTVAGITAGMFHLFTHAFFKALLFLGAGSVMHAMGNVIDVRQFGGLRHRMPWTHVTFLIGCLALAGICPFAGFWSKDQIVSAVKHKSDLSEHERSEADGGNATDITSETFPVSASSPTTETQPNGHKKVFRLLYCVSLFTAFLTAFYTFRVYFMTFFGPEKIPEEAGRHAHESPSSMCIPLAVLAGFSFLIGFVLEDSGFPRLLVSTPSLAYQAGLNRIDPAEFHLEFHMDVAMISSLVALSGVGLAAFLYLGHHREVQLLAKWLAPLRNLSYHKFYFDELYQFVIVLPMRAFATLSYFVDRWLIDGIVNGFARAAVGLGAVLRKWQTGLIPAYSLMMVLGAVIALILGTILWGGG